MFSPRSVDAKSLALHKLLVEKIRRDPALFDCVQRTLDRWHHETLMGKRPYFVAWQALVDKGMVATLAMAVEDSEHAQAMRQASPFAGILSEAERQEFLAAWSAARDHRP